MGAAKGVFSHTEQQSLSEERQQALQEPPPLWPEKELHHLRGGVCRVVPSSDNPFWQSNAVWVGCTEINQAHGYDSRSAASDLEIKIRVVARGNSPEVWDHCRPREESLGQLILASATGVRLRVRDIRIAKGNVEIILIIAVIKTTITGTGLVLGILTAFRDYDKIKAGFNEARIDCAVFIERVTYRLKGFFGGHGAPGPAIS